MSRDCRILIVGVGGQGCLTAARLLGAAAMRAGVGVRVGQLHGMAQRGGSVESTVCLGPGSTSFISDGEANAVLGLEPLETLRALRRMSRHTRVLLSDRVVVPFSLTLSGGAYPPLEEIVNRLRAVAPETRMLSGSALERTAGAPRSLNVAFLGALSALDLLPFPAETLRAVIAAHGRPTAREANLRAFDAGLAQLAGKPSARE